MKKLIKISSLLLLISIFASGCNTKNADEDLFQYKDSYVGDNSAIGNIVNQLQSTAHFKGFEFHTSAKPYGIVLNYDWAESDQNVKQTVIYNATYLFALVQNVDWITFTFDDLEYKITKENLDNWYGEDIRELQNEEELKTVIEKQLGDEEKVNRLFL